MVGVDRRSGGQELGTCIGIGFRYLVYIFVYRTFPPFTDDPFSAFEGLPRFLNKVREKAKLAGDEISIMSVSSPCTDINDI